MGSRRASRMYPVLSRPRLLAGVEHGLAVANITLAIVFTMHLRQWQLIPVFIFIHLLMLAGSRNEPQIRQVYRRYAGQGDRYDPFPRDKGGKTRAPRPEWWGKGVPC